VGSKAASSYDSLGGHHPRRGSTSCDALKKPLEVTNALSQSRCEVKVMWVLATRGIKSQGLDRMSPGELRERVVQLESQLSMFDPPEQGPDSPGARKTRSEGPAVKHDGVLVLSDLSEEEGASDDDDEEDVPLDTLANSLAGNSSAQASP